MAFVLRYRYKKELKEIGYANDRHHSIYDALAAAEGIDMNRYRMLEEQMVQAARRDKKMLKDFQMNYFRDLGFSAIEIVRLDEE